jgi:ABC-type branched-subunit amino acid transport system substrate-binding protein
MNLGYRIGALVALSASALGLAACGGSSSDTSSSGAIKVMAMGPIEAPQFSLESIKVGAEAAVDQINAEGGVNGEQIDLIVCNDGNDTNKAVACAREAVKEEVAAMVGGYTLFEPQVVPIIEAAGIPWIGPTAIQNSTSKSYFLLGGEGATLAFAMGLYLDEAGCKQSVAIGENLPTVKAAAGLVELGVQAGGGSPGEAVFGASNAADWAPVVAAATGAGADCLSILTSATNAPQVVAAVAQSGEQVTVRAPLSILPAESVAALGSAADGTILVSGYLPYSAKTPALKRLESKARKISPKVPLDAILESTYAAVKLFAHAAEGESEVDAASTVKALEKVKGYDTELGPIVDFTQGNPTKTFDRVVNTKVFVLEAQGGEIVLAQKQPLDTMPAFEALAAAGK